LARSEKSQRRPRKAPTSAWRGKKKRRWLGKILFYFLFPIGVWLAALLIWFYWAQLSGNFSGAEKKQKGAVIGEGGTQRRANDAGKKQAAPPEAISEDDRRNLDEILKRRQ
jgi:hypothetical protein